MSVVRCGKCGGFISGIPERTYEHPCTCTRPVDQIVYPIADAAYWKARAEQLQTELREAREALAEFIRSAEMRIAWDIMSEDEFNEKYPNDEGGWAHADVHEYLIQASEKASAALRKE